MAKVKQVLRRGRAKVKRAGSSVQSELHRVGDRLADGHLCLGVTGLSGSGKTTFITSLINQLMSFDHAQAALAGFSPALTQRILGVKLHRARIAGETFPYAENYRQLCGEAPQWPHSTTDISGCVLEIRLQRSRGILTRLGRPYKTLLLEILDYPGEWLLDLPMRQQSYLEWCRQFRAQYQQAERAQLLAQWAPQLAEIDPLATVDQALLGQQVAEFKQLLKQCKEAAGFSFVQPGRFLMPGSAEPELLAFLPLMMAPTLTDEQLKAAPKESYLRYFERCYADYLEQLVEPFYQRFFSKIDRQLVLVDVLTALHGGEDYVADMRQSLTAILDSFCYGQQSWLRQLIQPKVDRVAFVASKVDQVVSADHDNLRQLLATMVRQAFRQVQHEGIEPICEAAAAVRASVEVVHEGNKAVVATQQDGRRRGLVGPPIPTRLPQGEQWQAFAQWPLKPFLPPAGLSHANHDPLPHIRVDSVINSLIGDKCR